MLTGDKSATIPQVSNIPSLHIQTPIFRDAEVDAALGKSVWLKMECLQPTGSFKIRGIGLLCQELKAAGCSRFVSSSGGNAGYAVGVSAGDRWLDSNETNSATEKPAETPSAPPEVDESAAESEDESESGKE